MKKRIILLMTTILLVTAVMNNGAAAEKKPEVSKEQDSLTSVIDEEKKPEIFEEQDSLVSVIDKELRKVLEQADESELLAVDIWFAEVDAAMIEEQVKEKVGINRESIRESAGAGKGSELSGEIVDQYIETERKLYAEEQLRLHNQFIADYKDLVNLQQAPKDKDAFISEYSPLISVKLNKTEIATIAKDERVSMISQRPEWEYEDLMDISIPLIHANHIRDVAGYDGIGIRIGQIEGVMPSRGHMFLYASDITYDPGANHVYSGHADTVATIMVSKASGANRGIVPNAQLFATTLTNSQDWRPRVEWLLDQGVHVINMSATTNVNIGGKYETDAQWADHIAINHSVHFVVAAGNENKPINTAGMAYNGVTVGNADDRNTADESDDRLASDSSTRETGIGTNKPDLVAPGEGIYTPAWTAWGTSFAAPHVTGVIAQLLQQRPELRVLQDGVKAIITAAVSHSVMSYRTVDSEFGNSGAGMIDSQQASGWIVANSRYLTSNFAANSANGSEKAYTFYVSPSDTTIRVSLAFLKYNSCSGNHLGDPVINGRLANLDLRVLDPNGNWVGAASSFHSNLEVVKFTPPMPGTYTIVVEQTFNSDRPVYFGLAWW